MRNDRRQLRRHQYGRRRDRPAPLEYLHGNLPRRRRLAEQAQRRGRRLQLCRRRTKHESHAFAIASRQLQAPQVIRPGLRQPAQQGAETGAFQHLLDRPQAIRRFLRLHQQQVPDIDADLRQRRGKYPMRRRQQHDCFASRRQGPQSRRQQAEFAAALLRP